MEGLFLSDWQVDASAGHFLDSYLMLEGLAPLWEVPSLSR